MTTQTEFYVSHAGQTYGPWSVAEITERIASMELIATDYIYDDATEAWVPLLECGAIVEALRARKPAAPPSKAKPNTVVEPKPKSEAVAASASTTMIEDASAEGAEWFVQKDTHRYGPFTYLGLIKALQEKSVFDYDLVWRKGMEKWVRIAEHEMFTASAILRMKEKNLPETQKFFFQRKHPRFAISSEVIVHDNRSVWLGQTYLGSEGGAGLHIMNSLLLPGQVMVVHFSGVDGLPSFNALCEIVNKRYVRDVRDPRAPVPYGVRFVKMEPRVQSAVKDFYQSRIAA